MDKFKKISYNNQDYGVFELKYKNKSVPVILDWHDFIKIKELNKKWHINENGAIVTQHKLDNKNYDLYLHELIMMFKLKDSKKEKENRPILHINKLTIDNRRENLLYDTTNKLTNKNIKKKARIIELPKDTGVISEELPTFVWYLKPDKTHGERFFVSIGDINWKSSSSNKLSLRYKLEESKKFLRQLKESKPEIFDKFSMNGELTKDGKLLLSSFYNIVKQAGFNQLNNLLYDNLTDMYLTPNISKLSKDEKNLLSTKNFF